MYKTDSKEFDNLELIQSNDKIFKKKYKKQKLKTSIYCGNCGKFGHIYRNCNDLITSLGVVLIKINTDNKNIIKDLINQLKVENNETDKTDKESMQIKKNTNDAIPKSFDIFLFSFDNLVKGKGF